MSQKLWSSLTTTALILSTVGSTVGTANSSYANQVRTIDEGSAPSVSTQETPSPDDLSDQVAIAEDDLASGSTPSVDQPSNAQLDTEAQPDEVAKVGEYQSQEETVFTDHAIATIYSHELDGSLATTLYVDSIPVLTFLESDLDTDAATSTSNSESETKVGNTQSELVPIHALAAPIDLGDQSATTDESKQFADEPIWRAAAIAAQLNNLYQNRIDPSEIIVRWDEGTEQYVIVVGDEPLLSFSDDIILSGTTGDVANDALQATNRLRRLLGGAPPLEDIEGRPTPSPSHHVAVGPVEFEITGMASWYGPGFHGRRSASGEVFDQEALTAAHRTLPFGTQVRVTNMDTGLSVIVRINDRGPFTHNRVIDLSAGAARVIGMIGSGVAPVNVEVLSTISSAN